MDEALTERYALAPSLLRDFAGPLMRGTTLAIGDPLSARLYLDFVGGLLANEAAFATFQLELQRRVNRMFAEPPLIELQKSDLELVAAAYQFCWFYHGVAEDHRVWDRRQRNLFEEAMGLAKQVEPPADEVSVLARHLMLRHLPRVVRHDTHLSFSFLWSDLHFKGTEPKWVRLPGRSNPVIKRESVWVARARERPELHELLATILERSPLTRLLALPELGPQQKLGSILPVIAAPRLCRYATHALLEIGFAEVMAPLAVTTLGYLRDRDAHVLHRRYFARFVYNLALTWCWFTDEEKLARDLAADAKVDGNVAIARRQFYALMMALHDFRGELGAAHLFSDARLETRLRAFLDGGRVDAETARSVRHTVRAELRFAGA